ncbi:recombinase family protein [Escherichia coli]|nr:recombinase family protein [Escherichia coli]ELW0328643.1 recombinase family protein [Escherichia coli]ELW0350643.1 recombinase family protein [Escherichia coli]ELW0368327.1 recombinase family protein [Escherichia coli]ELW0373384.1 recombinase family protein [Escherichia coli]
MKRKFVYRRVSTCDQNLDRQLPNLPYDDTKEYLVYSDKKSGKDFEREGWKALVKAACEGDEIYIHSLDRMGRNMLGILKELDYLVKEKKVTLHFEKESLTLKAGEDLNPMANAMVQMLGMFAELERSLIKERQKEGIAAAKARGVHCGRPAKGLRFAEVDKEAVLAALAEGHNVSEVARNFGISRQMVYRIKAAN